ncbi:DUF3800 domain-containing protein [Candidatus Saccharibacteria bacterium]|nr:DUF3800 domain-containing protein [Candidatus Saccharibacteria bacterium]
MENSGPKPRSHVYGFMDETGLLHTPRTDRVFALGLIISQNPRELHRAVVILKNKRRYHKEFKFSEVSDQNLPIYKELIDLFLECTNNRFHALLVDKHAYAATANKKSHWEYNKLAAKLIASSIDYKIGKASEYLTVLADDVSTSKDDKFEKIVRDRVKKDHRRNALFGICRLESHAVSEIQVTDVLLGLVAYAYKIKFEIVRGSGAKLKLLKHLQRRLGVEELANTQAIKLQRGEVFEVSEHK